jgi:flagellar hook assembly protein FlgD
MLLHLYPAAPNPFNPRTTIRFDLPAAGTVRLAIYDVAGRLVKVLVEGEIPAGSHEAVWDGRDTSGRSAPSGSYLARLVAGGRVEGVRLSLVR